MKLMVFSKHLAGPPLEEAAVRLRSVGIESIDLTVRPGGHVEPDAVEADLPLASRILGDNGIEIGMITTNITDANDPATARILDSAAALGIGYYKIGYYPYRGFGTIKQQRLEVAHKLQALGKLNLKIGIHGGFHNHSAEYFGAVPADIYQVLADADPAAIGFYFDPMHATVEGGSSGWLMGMDLLSARISMLAVKDYLWIECEGGCGGARRYKVQVCPLGEGNVEWLQVLRYLHQAGFSGPISLHSEYQGVQSFADLSTNQVFEQTRRDVLVFRNWLDSCRMAENNIGFSHT